MVAYDSPIPTGGPLLEFIGDVPRRVAVVRGARARAHRVIPNADAAPPIVNAAILPLLFLSGHLHPAGRRRRPQWITTVADIFPVKHFADAMRAGFLGNIEVRRTACLRLRLDGCRDHGGVGTRRPGRWRPGSSAGSRAARGPVLRSALPRERGGASVRKWVVMLAAIALHRRGLLRGDPSRHGREHPIGGSPAEEYRGRVRGVARGGLRSRPTRSPSARTSTSCSRRGSSTAKPESGKGFESALAYEVASRMGFSELRGALGLHPVQQLLRSRARRTSTSTSTTSPSPRSGTRPSISATATTTSRRP